MTRTRRRLGIVVLGFIVATGTVLGQRPATGLQVDQLFAPWNHKDSPGCVVLVRQDGKTVHERAYGMANLELGVPLSLSSVFLLASVSKQFVVFAILLLMQGGRLSLEDDVRKHIPELPEFGKTITLRHLINHTSGLREDLTLFNLAGWRNGDVVTRTDILRLVKNQKELNFPPGEEYLYCNTGYHLLAMVVERLAQQPFPAFAREKIFVPLGMTATVVRDNHRTLIPDLAVPYGPRVQGKFQLSPVAHDPPGASNVHSTVGDLALWDQSFYDSADMAKELRATMQVRGKLNTGKEIKYAGGLMIDTYRDLKTVSHTGSHGGYKTIILRFPEQRFSVIILANIRNFNTVRMARKVADIYLAGQLSPVPTPTEVKIDAAALTAYPGEYRFGFALWKVARDKQGLTVQIDGGDKKQLVPSAENEFFDREDGMRYRFQKLKDGMLLETTLDKQKNVGRTPRVLELAPTKLANYAGTYLAEELGTFGSIEARSGKLYLQLPKGQAVLQFLANGDCLARPLDANVSLAVLRFATNAGGVATGYTLSTERVRNLRYAKVTINRD